MDNSQQKIASMQAFMIIPADAFTEVQHGYLVEGSGNDFEYRTIDNYY